MCKNPDTETEYYEHHRFHIDKGQSLVRIDKYLPAKISHITRHQIQKALKMNCILVNNHPVKTSYRIKPLDIITIILPGKPPDKTISPEPIPLDIIYEDKYLLLVNKPAGMLIHPTFNQFSGTLWNGIIHHYEQLPESEKELETPGLIHRIDQNTSGLILIAKEKETREELLKQFATHSITRKYIALVWGNIAENSGTISENLLKNPETDRMEVNIEGKTAITHYKVIERFRDLTLVECSLETGRTHQIRAHMKYLGHPLFNDAFYSGDVKKNNYQTQPCKGVILNTPFLESNQKFFQDLMLLLPGQALHAYILGFIHHVKGYIEFEVKNTHGIEKILERLRNL